MKYTYSCYRCGLRHELSEPAKLVGGHFLCDGCMEDAANTFPSVRDSGDPGQLTLDAFSTFLSFNPTRRA